MTVDPLERAYAILGLRRGCNSSELKRTYKLLVRRWHPDRHAGDPVGQAEASARLREINGAFRLIAQEVNGDDGRSQPSVPVVGGREAEREPGRPLSKHEIDAMVGAIGNEGPIDFLLDWFQLVWPFGVAFLVLVQPRGSRPPTAVEAVLAVGLIAFGIGLLVRKRALSWRKGRPTRE